MALLLTSLGTMATTRVLADISQQQRANRQEQLVAAALQDAMEDGGSGWGSGTSASTSVALSDGTVVALERRNRHWPLRGDPSQGQHRDLVARWIDPWGVRQERTLQTYWWMAPRIY